LTPFAYSAHFALKTLSLPRSVLSATLCDRPLVSCASAKQKLETGNSETTNSPAHPIPAPCNAQSEGFVGEPIPKLSLEGATLNGDNPVKKGAEISHHARGGALKLVWGWSGSGAEPRA